MGSSEDFLQLDWIDGIDNVIEEPGYKLFCCVTCTPVVLCAVNFLLQRFCALLHCFVPFLVQVISSLVWETAVGSGQNRKRGRAKPNEQKERGEISTEEQS